MFEHVDLAQHYDFSIEFHGAERRKFTLILGVFAIYR